MCLAVYLRLARLMPTSSSVACGDQFGLAHFDGFVLGQWVCRACSMLSCRALSGSGACSQAEALTESTRPCLSSLWSAKRLLPARVSNTLAAIVIFIGMWSSVSAHSLTGLQDSSLFSIPGVAKVRSIVVSRVRLFHVGFPLAVISSSPRDLIAYSRCSAYWSHTTSSPP